MRILIYRQSGAWDISGKGHGDEGKVCRMAGRCAGGSRDCAAGGTGAHAVEVCAACVCAVRRAGAVRGDCAAGGAVGALQAAADPAVCG